MIPQFIAVFLLHALPTWTIIRFAPLPPGDWIPAVIGTAAFQSLLLVFGRDIAFKKDTQAARMIYRISMISFVLTLDLFMASLAYLAIRVISLPVLHFLGFSVPTSAWGFKLIYTLALIHVVWGLINARRLTIRRVPFIAAGFPDSWNGRRILFFSDTHYGSLNGPNMAERLVKITEKEAPDLIICGGDLFDGPGGDVEAILKTLSRIKAPIGVLAVLGNHDYYYLSIPGSSRQLLNNQRHRKEMPFIETSQLARVMNILPWRFLENESIIMDGVVFVGLRPYSLADEKAARKTLAGLDTEQPTILINHKPILAEEAAAAGVRLQLSGHTHGGPVFPMNVMLRHILKGRHFGTSRIGSLVLDVSSGSGISLWYPRTAGRHEVVIVEMAVTE